MASTKVHPGIPDPSTANVQESVRAIKQIVEVLIKQRGSKANAAVTFQDLVDLGLITPSQIPT